MEIFLDKRAVRQIRLSAADAIEEGDTETLREDLIEAFPEELVEEIERRVDAADFYEFIADVVSEWSCEDVDELFELLEAHLADADVDLKYTTPEFEEDDDDELEEEDYGVYEDTEDDF